MSNFISGNSGIMRKSDVFSLEIDEPNQVTNTKYYQIVATYLKNDFTQIVVLEKSDSWLEIFNTFERMKKELAELEE